MKILSLILLFSSAISLAQTLQIDLSNKTPIIPASDLVYKNKIISSDQAMELKKNGFDLSTLDPVTSDFYQNKTLSTEDGNTYPSHENLSLDFDGFKRSPTEIFRSFVITKIANSNTRYTLSAGLDVHAVIARATLLRKLGYDVDIPKYYPELKINFSSIQEKQDFLISLSDKTLTARSRWVKSEEDLSLVLKSMVLEPAEIKTLNIYWGIMDASRQETRRSFRALLIPFMITYYPEIINDISWEQGRIFDQTLFLTHPYAEEFSDTTVDDLKWSLKKILNLTREDWIEIFSQTYYPHAIKELLIEKTISRARSLAQRLNTKQEILAQAPKFNRLLTIDNIVNGKVIRAPDSKDNYALSFYQKDPLSPYRLAEVLRFFGSKLAYSGMSYLIRKAQETYIPIDPKDALRELDKMAFDGDDVKKSFVSAPYINGRTRAERKIVFGQFQGSDAPIQVVDSFAIEANLGLLARSTTDVKVNPVVNIGATATRQFLHIKAMPDIQTATKQKLFNVYIPAVLKKLSNKIKKVTCEISEKPFYEESIIEGEVFYQIKYDEKLVNGFNLALEYKKELIQKGFNASKILILKIDRMKLCQEETKQQTNDLINKFLESFSSDETFIVTDEVRLSAGANSVFSLNYPATIGISLSGRVTKGLGRSFIIRKKETGFEVVFHNQNVLSKDSGYGLNYFINFLDQDFRRNKYKINTEVFFLDLKEGDLEKKKIALMTLKSLFSNRSEEIINEYYKPIEVDHDLNTRHNILRFLLWSKDKFTMNHDIKIGIEDDKGVEHKRTFYSFIKAKRRGKDFFEFGKQVFSDLFTDGLADAVLPPPPVDPGQSIAGNSFRYVIFSEVETTKNQPENMVTQVHWGYKGSGAKQKKLFKFFDHLEGMIAPFTNKVIDRGPFSQMEKLKTYDLLATLILYPKAHEIIEELMNPNSLKSNINKVIKLYGREKYLEVCPRVRIKQNEVCTPSRVKKFLSFFKEIKNKRNLKLKKKVLSEAIYYLFDKFPPENVLTVLGSEHFFFAIKVAGFRTNNASGYINYVSDTVGKYDQKLGSGLIDYISKKLKVTSFEVKGLRFAPGLQ